MTHDALTRACADSLDREGHPDVYRSRPKPPPPGAVVPPDKDATWRALIADEIGLTTEADGGW